MRRWLIYSDTPSDMALASHYCMLGETGLHLSAMPLIGFPTDLGYRTMKAFDPYLWRGVYASFGRYLEDLSDTELCERYGDILKNKAAFSADRYVAHTPLNSPSSFWYWVRKEEEIEEEFRLRDRPLPDVAWEVPAALTSLVPPWSRTSFASVDFVARFGADSWLRGAYTHGRFRLKHARGYQDTGLNKAQRDDELTASRHSPGRSVKITTLDGKPIIPRGKVTYRNTFECDAYLLCSSSEFDPALFHHFGGDACLVVYNLDAFRDRIERAFAQVMPGYGFFYLPVTYLDEYNANPILCRGELREEEVEYRPIETKSITFAHQKEYRFFWYSLQGTTNGPAHIEIEAGPLADIADYYILDHPSETLRKIP